MLQPYFYGKILATTAAVFFPHKVYWFFFFFYSVGKYLHTE